MAKEINGVLVVDKPKHISSAKLVGNLKKKLKIRKIGHAGTLDPMASGVLICLLNKATRLSGFFLSDEKTYKATLRLGIETDTQDATGVVINRTENATPKPLMIRDVFDRFSGELEQMPPIYSALKHQGVPLYKLARRGKPVQKPPRKIVIYELEIEKMAPPYIEFRVRCSAGTYIRTLCADIGTQLGCGGHLTSLRRTECSGFSLAQAVTLEDIERLAQKNQTQTRIISMSDALGSFTEVVATHDLLHKIGFGQTVYPHDFSSIAGRLKDGYIKVVNGRKELLAIMEVVQQGCGIKYQAVFCSQNGSASV